MVLRGLSGLKWAAGAVACLCLSGAAIGAETDSAILERLKALEQKNSELESKLSNVQRSQSSRTEVDKAIAKAEATLGSVVTNSDPHGRALRIGGTLAVSYQYNFNQPDNQNNNLRAYDRDSNGFNVHEAELNFDRLPTKSGEAGFRVDLAYGTDASKYAATHNNAGGDSSINLQQAYISYIAPVGNGLTIDAGKFVTWSGAEVIEANSNINFSRSLLYTYAIPTTHTGARMTYEALKDKWTLGLGVNNGWDNIQDQNDGKSVVLMSDLKIGKKFQWQINGSVGTEGATDERTVLRSFIDAGNSVDPTALDFTYPGLGAAQVGKIWDGNDGGDPRGLVDWTMTFTPTEELTLAFNGDIGFESANTWWGGAFYVKWQFAKNWYIANRIEYFSDEAGARTGRAQALWENTLTLDWKLSEPLHMRFEYRHDGSNIDSFADTRGVSNAPVRQNLQNADRQDTVLVGWLYSF